MSANGGGREGSYPGAPPQSKIGNALRGISAQTTDWLCSFEDCEAHQDPCPSVPDPRDLSCLEASRPPVYLVTVIDGVVAADGATTKLAYMPNNA